MNAATTKLAWLDANQRYLAAALATVRAALERHAAREGSGASGAELAAKAEEEAGAQLPEPSALEVLCATFGLSRFERAILLLCAGFEMDGAFAARCAAAQQDAARPFPTYALALAAFPEAHWSALAPDAPLRFWRLIEVGAGASLATSALRIDERVLHHLAGVLHLDERLAGLVEPVPSPSTLVPSHAALADGVAAGWREPAGRRAPVVQLCGGDAAGIREVAAAACDRAGLKLFAMPAAFIPHAATDAELLRRLWDREAALSGCALLLDCDRADAAETMGAALLDRWIETSRSPLVVASREPRRRLLRGMRIVEVSRPSAREQRTLWEQALGPAASGLNGQLDGIVAQFDMNASSISAAADAGAGFAAARRGASPADGGEAMAAALWKSCRALVRPRLDDLAQRIESQATWSELVLPERAMRSLREIAAHVRHRRTVYEQWGFAAQSSRGLGIGALFSGPSGTGKTLAAEILAGELKLDLYRIDLSQVVSKYIGETEKNLRRVFEAAEEGGAVLLFDEADALFGKRSEVKDSHDRYANIEVSYLLQRMEAYRGLAILTTNMKEALDPAFLRRLRFVVPFPFPDAALRAEIWRRMFPREAPSEGLDAAQLARLNIAGGNIRNIALNAAFLAAGAAEPIGMRHLLQAARSEYAKMERALTETEIGGWP